MEMLKAYKLYFRTREQMGEATIIAPSLKTAKESLLQYSETAEIVDYIEVEVSPIIYQLEYIA